MTADDLDQIERELSIRLPEIYRKTVSPFPIPALAGNADDELWDNPTKLIALNRELRAGSTRRQPWPEHLFAVGEMDGESDVAIDLRYPEAPTWWVDHGYLENDGSGQTHSRFADWAREHIEGIRSDLAGDGQNPEGTPEERAAIQEAEFRGSLRGCLVVAVVLILGVVAWVWLR